MSGAASATRMPGVGEHDEQDDDHDRAPISPNSWPISAKMKSLKAFGTNTRLSPSPRPEQPARRPSASRPWTVWKPAPSGSAHGIEPGPDALQLVVAQADSDHRQRRRPSQRAAEVDRGSRRRRRTS